MIYLNVPYAEKDAAKALGARWDFERKCWYAPGPVVLSACLRWQIVPEPEVTQCHTASRNVTQPKKASAHHEAARYNAKVKPITGERYFKLDCNCLPWEPCLACQGEVERSGWI